MDDRALIALCAQGDRQAWLVLIGRYHHRILRLHWEQCLPQRLGQAVTRSHPVLALGPVLGGHDDQLTGHHPVP